MNGLEQFRNIYNVQGNRNKLNNESYISTLIKTP